MSVSQVQGSSGRSSVGPAVCSVPGRLPLAVDLDGTLLKSDLLWESFLSVIRQNVLFLFWIPLWLLRGKAHLKRELAARAKLDVALLPFHDNFLVFLQSEHKQGRPLVLTTAADRSLADSVAGHLGIFAGVLASDGKVNLKGKNKSTHLLEMFGEKGFDYAGNDAADLAVWSHANAALPVNAGRRLTSKAQKLVRLERVFDDRKARLRVFLRALRVRHWIKNLLVFVPVVTSHRWTDASVIVNCGLAFLAFSFVASSVYVLNDLCDLQNDRRHTLKKNRPFASGELSIISGILIIPALLIVALALSLVLPAGFLAILGSYYVLNVGYSLYLKQVVLLDVLMLAVFYSVRISAGGLATAIPISHWLLIFSVFIFLSLASGKRASELQELRKQNREAAFGRGYFSQDLEQLSNQGITSGYIAVLVLALYIYSPEVTVLYKSPQLLWLICPILIYWISRFWLLVHRGLVQEDPLLFVTKDKVSFAVGLLTMLVILISK